MTHVLLVGAFGQGNPGDDALCDAFRRSLHRCSFTIATQADEHGDAQVVTPAALPVMRCLRSTDVAVVCGGTIFKRLHPSAGRAPNALLRSTAGLIAACRARRVPVALVGVGAGELSGRESKAIARWIVRHSDLLVLRDEESAAVLGAAGAEMPLRVGADPAWTLFRGNDARRLERRSGEAITVAVSHLAGDHALGPRMAAALAPFAETHPIHLQPWQVGAADRDAVLAADIAARIGGTAEVVAPPSDLVAARDGYRHDRLVVAMRFHALVAAGAAGTTTLAIAHEPKLAGLARRLGQPAVPPHASVEVLRHAIHDALEHPAASPTAVAGEAMRATTSLGLLQLLVDRGETNEPAEVASPPLSNGAGWW